MIEGRIASELARGDCHGAGVVQWCSDRARRAVVAVARNVYMKSEQMEPKLNEVDQGSVLDWVTLGCYVSKAVTL
jgi:hypothetical protein